MTSPSLSRRALGLVAVSAASGLAAAPALAQMPAGSMVGPLTEGNWFEEIKAQHREIARLFQAVKDAPDDATRQRQFKMLSTLLAAHSIAEEVSIYPAIYIEGNQAGAKELYDEQQMAKIMVARIQDAMGAGRADQAMSLLAQLDSAVKAHVAEEEQQRFPALMSQAAPGMNAKLTAELRTSFTRYMTG